jgi:hypothetical protein
MGKWVEDKLTVLLVLGAVMLLVLLALIASELLGAQEDADPAEGERPGTVAHGQPIPGR